MSLSPGRLALALKRLDRWREIPRCYREFDRSSSLALTYLGMDCYPRPGVVRHRSGLILRITEFADIEALWQIFLRRVYEVRPSDRNIVDAGGNIGLFSCYAAWRAPQAQILTIEPFPSTVERLRQHVAVNNLTCRVRILPVALSAEAGQTEMVTSSLSSQENAVGHTNGTGGIRVPCVTLGAALEGLPERIDLLKMDIEASEYEVLMNTPTQALSRFRRISLEHHSPPPGSRHTKAALIQHLRDAGFSVRQAFGSQDSDWGILFCEHSVH